MQQTGELRLGDHVLIVTDLATAPQPVFLLVHGIGMGREAYSEFVEELGGRGRVLAVDLPGFGDSPTPDRSLPITGMADLVAELLQHRGTGPVVAVGHSMGTQVVAELAVRHPDLVSHLVLIGPTVNAGERTAGRQVFRFLQDMLGEHPRVIGRGMWLYAKTGPAWFVRKFRTMMDHRIEDILPDVAVPTLVMRGAHDRVCPEPWVRSVTDAVPGARMVQIPGKTHETMIRSAEPVAEVVARFARS
ncbi:alpha/beta fold hydrolase [Georgenia sp. MJ170]|uniref:alpha/beta fold hydrolase n=1 Tax=Georgenia sunbinii TaxID=3117728 RepID=UPI002F260825